MRERDAPNARLGIMKAKYPDEALALGQLKAGTNVTIVTDVNDDVTINATGGGETLPAGTENQTLRYNASNALESNSILAITDNSNIEAVEVNTYKQSLDGTKQVQAEIQAVAQGGGAYDEWYGAQYGYINLITSSTTDDSAEQIQMYSKNFGDPPFEGKIVIDTHNLLIWLKDSLPSVGKVLKCANSEGKVEWADGTNKAVSLASLEVFNNLEVLPDTVPLPSPITTYRLLGDPTDSGTTIFQLPLLAGKKYKVDVCIVFPYTGTTSGYHHFQLKLLGGASWDSLLWWSKENSNLLHYYPDITQYAAPNYNQMGQINFSDELAFYYENDSSISYTALRIQGVVQSNDDADNFQIAFRNILRSEANGSYPSLISANSYMSAVECE